MVERKSHETLDIYSNLNVIPLNDQQQFILNRINETKDYFVAEISKYIAFFSLFL